MPKPQFSRNIEKAIQQALRVNHAGERAACKICEGQIAGSKSSDKEKFFEMLVQEREHLDFFNKELPARKIRPTILIPIWDKLSYALGYLSSKYSLKVGMIAVEAIEEVIEKHYNDQIPLLNQEPELQKVIKKFRDDEIAHKNAAQAHSKSLNFPEAIFFKLIQHSCRAAISISKRI